MSSHAVFRQGQMYMNRIILLHRSTQLEGYRQTFMNMTYIHIYNIMQKHAYTFIHTQKKVINEPE